MARIDKLIERLKSKPADFRWSELEKVLKHFRYEQIKNNGSRRKFVRIKENGEKDLIIIHEPHPKDILKEYQLNDVIEKLDILK